MATPIDARRPTKIALDENWRPTVTVLLYGYPGAYAMVCQHFDLDS